MTRQIEPITRSQVIDGFGRSVFCYMYGIKGRAFQCGMWRDIFDETRGIGFRALEDGDFAGHVVFMPKKYARRIGLPTCRANDRLETTIEIACLYVPRQRRKRGVATDLIAHVLAFCRSHGFDRVEANVNLAPAGDAEYERISFLPFRKLGFLVDDDSPVHEPDAGAYFVGNMMCYLSL